MAYAANHKTEKIKVTGERGDLCCECQPNANYLAWIAGYALVHKRVK